MKIRIMSIALLILVSLSITPYQIEASEKEPAELLASLNTKTAKIINESTNDKKPNGTITRELEVNSYIFTLDRKILKITFNEEIQTFENAKHIETYTVAGQSSTDTGNIDLQKTGIYNGLIAIVCQSDRKCLNTEERSIEYYAENEKTIEKARKSQANAFNIRGASQPLADQISKNLTDLFSLLVSAVPAEKTGAATSAKDNANP